MSRGIMQKLTYTNPPQYRTYSSYRKYLRSVSNCSCTYCTITESESPGATFVIEHFRPKSLFKDLECECTNLRYACPRCNSYKSDLWISAEQGCAKNCPDCGTHICHTNIERFVDCLIEDPDQLMYLKEDNTIYAYSGSFAAKYTIEFLRLNRSQLVKLRYVRRFMESWREELNTKLKDAEQYRQSLDDKKHEFEAAFVADQFKNEKERIQHDMSITLYDMMIIQSDQSILFIKNEINKLDHLLDNRTGNDEIISSDKSF